MRPKSDDRYELKFLIRREQQEAISADLASFVQPDEHGDVTGQYTVTSLYYDTEEYKAYWDKLEGHRFRRKVRLRVYGDEPVVAQTPCYVEIKQRLDKTLRKKRARLSYGRAVALDTFDDCPDVAPDAQRVLSEVHYLYRTLDLRPTCIVRYTRCALNGNESYPDLRVTFDTQLRCRGHSLSLLQADEAEMDFFLSPTWAVLEIKANHTIPYWLAKLVSKHRCTPQRFSKYCTALETCVNGLQRQRIVV